MKAVIGIMLMAAVGAIVLAGCCYCVWVIVHNTKQLWYYYKNPLK